MKAMQRGRDILDFVYLFEPVGDAISFNVYWSALESIWFFMFLCLGLRLHGMHYGWGFKPAMRSGIS